MDREEKKSTFGVNIGSSSILIIFVILCLVSFAVLSIVSANADKKLTNRVSERITAYYEANNKAEEILSDIDNELLEAYKNSSDASEYFAAVDYTRSYSVAIDETQNLYVSLNIKYPSESEDCFYQITSWRIINSPQTTIIE